jgi:hypothetical protein
MQIARLFSATVFYAIFLAACVSLVPGADKIRITRNASDVSACGAVGNIRVPHDDILNADAVFRNQTVGLGGNTAFVTSDRLGEGVAYRCP